MPKVPINYNNCCMYKIEHIEDDSLLCVGFTTNFNKRKGDHKSRINNVNGNKYNYKLYQMRRENGGWKNFNMIEIEKYPCSDRREAEKRETEIMKELKASMNMVRSYVGISKKEADKIYRDTHNDRKKELSKIYREAHKEEIKEKSKIYRDNIKELKKNN